MKKTTRGEENDVRHHYNRFKQELEKCGATEKEKEVIERCVRMLKSSIENLEEMKFKIELANLVKSFSRLTK